MISIALHTTFWKQLNSSFLFLNYQFYYCFSRFREDGLEPITLATHATSDMMGTLEYLTSTWNGPISVGVFIDYHSSQALEHLAEMHRCDIEFRKKVRRRYKDVLIFLDYFRCQSILLFVNQHFRLVVPKFTSLHLTDLVKSFIWKVSFSKGVLYENSPTLILVKRFFSSFTFILFPYWMK